MKVIEGEKDVGGDGVFCSITMFALYVIQDAVVTAIAILPSCRLQQHT